MRLTVGYRGIVVLLVAAVALIGGAAYATIPDSNRVIHTCYLKSGGTLRVIDDSVTKCKSTETALPIIQHGEQGPPGPPGAFFANIDGFHGAVIASSPGVTSVRTGEGDYEVTFPSDVDKCGAAATIGFNHNGGIRPTIGGAIQADLNEGIPKQIDLRTYLSDGTARDSSFHLVVVC